MVMGDRHCGRGRRVGLRASIDGHQAQTVDVPFPPGWGTRQRNSSFAEEAMLIETRNLIPLAEFYAHSD